MNLGSAIIRGFQLIFGIVVLGLSVTLAKNQVIYAVPAATGYAAFTGGIGIVSALLGIASLFVESLEGLISWAVDGLAALALLAGGITYAVLLRGTNCSNPETLWQNTILGGGCTTYKGTFICAYDGNPGKLEEQCRSATADTAFMFMTFIMCLAAAAFGFFTAGRR
ncbi:hypothetical protein N7510_001095 [Penicillium lagena]|uniref:uncharacterized protein n=1 Tax=Penicillium lagena TaxID=94218 RepID=UPI002541361D|nr:uncharacterized protein N7510_001095 [Penicillium lagena]KAJ5624786.1 hypothetical protein N7510_001095 [Penicillium lagena]